ncbi:histidine kinase [Pseudoalteromonas obscura]|uniref:Histidine kinase n=1 Tax=Pseudoalteromonas obscura TaxID=3048491 RepID=A0ABT7EKS3_9GAMM|nr:sensor histidine kinase [Pseudoalteromonas sp. P94(2023)]MDK2595623.1 histidine kinase [Pseudoalteromonas sp. P94(2023)]
MCLLIGVLAHKSFANSALQGVSNLRQAPFSESLGQGCHSIELDDRHWQTFQFPNIQPQQHLCIRGTLTIVQEQLPPNPTLLFLALAAYEIYLNGELIGKNGVPGSSKTYEQVGAISSLTQLDYKTMPPGEHLISLELSSFHTADAFAAIAYALAIVDQQTFYQTIIVASSITAMLIGGLLVLFVIFLTVYLRYSHQTSHLIFALLCVFTLALLVAEQWKLWVNYYYDVHLLRMNIVVALTLVVTSLLPSYYLAQHNISRKSLWLTALALTLLAVVYSTTSFDARSAWLFCSSLLFVGAINVIALRHNKAGSVIALLICAASLIGFILAPRLFLEFGFALSITLVLASIGISLLNQLIKQRNLALEAGKVKGELLRRNLQPHYLMNCLMQVQELIDFAPTQANEFVQQLAEEFRALVKVSEKEVVTLEEELRLCHSHLKIMSVRYQQNYQLVTHILPDSATHILVPTAIVHSQIENCFTHNRITSDRPIKLSVQVGKSRIILELTTPIDAVTQHQGMGIGDAYIRAKMAQVCESDWQLDSCQVADHWVTRYEYQIRPKFT